MTPAQKRLSEGYCRACSAKRSERSRVFCDVHLEQATRWQAARSAEKKGTGKWSPVSKDAREGMRLMRSRGDSLAKIARTFGYTITSVFRHVRDITFPRKRTGSDWR